MGKYRKDSKKTLSLKTKQKIFPKLQRATYWPVVLKFTFINFQLNKREDHKGNYGYI